MSGVSGILAQKHTFPCRIPLFPMLSMWELLNGPVGEEQVAVLGVEEPGSLITWVSAQ